jgi:hypothetical protein
MFKTKTTHPREMGCLDNIGIVKNSWAKIGKHIYKTLGPVDQVPDFRNEIVPLHTKNKGLQDIHYLIDKS